MTLRKWIVPVQAAVASLALIVAACTPASPPAAPTAAPAPKAAPTTAPAKPAAAPTAAPAKPAAKPTEAAAKPAAKPTEAAAKQAAKPTEAAAKPAAKPAAAAQEARRGGTLVLPLSTDPSTLNCGVESSQIVAAVTSSVFSGLTLLDDKGAPHPDLAQRWEVSPDGRVYTFHLRQNARWHDGQPLTSADVKYSFEHLVGKFNSRGRAVYDSITSIETPDNYTVVFTLAEPYEPFLRILSAHNGCIQPKHLYEGTDPLTNEYNEKPVGSGPFKFVEWVKGSHLTLERNETYHKQGRPFLDGITFRIIPDRAGRAVAMRTGEVSGIWGSNVFPYAQLDQVRQLPNTYFRDIGDPSMIGLHLNHSENPILAKLEVRQAIAHAINKPVLVQLGFTGSGKVIDSPIPEGIPWAYNPNLPKYEFDVAKANQLLDQAGYPRQDGGTRFQLRLAFEAGNANSERPAEILREQFRAVGIDLVLERLERAIMLPKVFKDYDFDMWWGPLTTSGHPAIGVARTYHTNAINQLTFQNLTKYSNPRVDELFDLAVSSTNRQEVVRAYHEIQEILMRDLPSIPVADRIQANIVHEDFHNALSSPEQFERTDEIWWVNGTPLNPGEFEPIPPEILSGSGVTPEQ